MHQNIFSAMQYKEEYLEPCQTIKMEPFAKKPQTVFAKSSTIDA